MHIRESTEADIPDIVDLLKKSLGETSSPKSINYWIWKHLNNPFGPSKVLLAERNGQLIGVRAMMQWHWQKNERKFSTLRAVDTATDPDFQGQGIFSVLTRKMIDRSHADGIDFIFNTPNTKSFPGYIKLGWVALGKLLVGFSFVSPFFRKRNKSSHGSIELDKIELLCTQWNHLQQQKNLLFTPKSIEYLKWRYLNNPVIKYFVYANADIFLAMYSRKRKNFSELRVAELICTGITSTSMIQIQKVIRNYAHEKNINLISYAPSLQQWIPGFKLSLPLGPKLCTKKVNVALQDIKDLKIAYSLGDMELF